MTDTTTLPASGSPDKRSVLVLNAGSSSLKYRVFAMAGDGSGQELASGSVERIAEDEGGAANHQGPQGSEASEHTFRDHEAALRWVMERLDDDGLTDGLTAIGHRVVHGGDAFSAPALVDDDAVAEVEACVPLAPLHNPANLLGIRVATDVRPDLPNVMVFDTAFHATMPASASTYALPRELASEHGIRRYGFHGTSHAFVSRRAAGHLRSHGHAAGRLVTLHLGNGASMAAVRDGECVDTSMGLSPLEGLVMGTRSGDVDPSVVFLLLREAGLSLDEVEQVLIRESGLKGLCGDNDLREVGRRAEEGDEAAQLALGVYVHRIRRYLGAFVAVLGGADALVFTAGVGENDAGVRARACAGLERLGIVLDAERNRRVAELADAAEDGIVDVAASSSSTRVLVVATNEELEIARQTLTVLAN